MRMNFDPPEPRKYTMMMPVMNQPPINLSRNEMLAVVSGTSEPLGGKVTVGPADMTRQREDSTEDWDTTIQQRTC